MLNQQQTLEQTLNPKLQLGLKILQSNSLELSNLIRSELESNPLLEEYIPDEIPISDNKDEDYIESQKVTYEDEDKKRMFLESIPEKISFQEYLRQQAKLEIKEENVLEAFNFLADFLDSRGYLEADAKENCLSEGFSEEDILCAKKYMQSFEPAGVGAKDIRQCFMIQLRQRGRSNSWAYRILESYYDLLSKRRVQEIARLMNIKESDVEQAIEELSTLEPSPAKAFSDEGSREIFADLLFFKNEDEEWQVAVSDKLSPRLRINNQYRELLGKQNITTNDATYIKEKIRDGKNFMELVENRKNTLLRLGEYILENQKTFFTHGKEFLKPMTMNDAASSLSLNISTISRTVSGKYAEIQEHGLLALKYFFSGGYAFDNHNEDRISSHSIKDEIATIVKNENPAKPLSDSEIVEILAEKNLNIARRTVSKYREELKIPSKSLRKRYI